MYTLLAALAVFGWRSEVDFFSLQAYIENVGSAPSLGYKPRKMFASAGDATGDAGGFDVP